MDMRKWMVLVLLASATTGAHAAEKETPEQIFAAMDADKNGKVSIEEYVAYDRAQAKEKGKQFDKQRSEKKFKKKDVDQDSALTKSEMQEVKREKSSSSGSDEGGGGGE
jgi:hypothetical protein